MQLACNLPASQSAACRIWPDELPYRNLCLYLSCGRWMSEVIFILQHIKRGNRKTLTTPMHLAASAGLATQSGWVVHN